MQSIKSTVISIILVISLTSCNTIKVWTEKSSYKETFKDFFVTENGSKIVILGKRYHYIFDDNSSLIKQVLSWNARPKLEISIYNFEVDGSNKIKGLIDIRGLHQKGSTKKLNENEEKFLENLGFKKQRNVFEKRIYITGKRYRPKPGVSYKLKSHLSKEYKTRVRYSGTKSAVKKITLTPITVVADGTSIALGTAVAAIAIPLIIPIFAVICIKDPGGACS